MRDSLKNKKGNKTKINRGPIYFLTEKINSEIIMKGL